MVGFDAWETELFDRYNGEYEEVTEADLWDTLYDDSEDDWYVQEME